MMRKPPGGRSFSEMANEQLNGRRKRDPLAEGMEAAVTPDCIRPPAGKEVLTGLLAAPLIAQRAMQEKCK
jgi:hypothetical protein